MRIIANIEIWYDGIENASMEDVKELIESLGEDANATITVNSYGISPDNAV